MDKRDLIEARRLKQSGKSQLRAAVKPLIHIEEEYDD
jgi:hypothetical protein